MHSFLLIFIALLFSAVGNPLLIAWTTDEQGLLLYQAQRGNSLKAIDEYRRRSANQDEVDFDLLHKLTALFLLERWQHGSENEQLTVLLGAALSRNELLEKLQWEAAKGENPILQLVAVRLAGCCATPTSSAVLLAVLHSPYVALRLEALQVLAERGDPLAEAQLQALMERIEPAFHHYFIPLFSALPRESSCRSLKRFLNHSCEKSRIAAVHAIAEGNHDRLIPAVRALVRQGSPPLVEAAAMALGHLGDSESSEILWQLTRSPHAAVAAAAATALCKLGDEQAAERLLELAANDNLFAIRQLPQLTLKKESSQLLAKLLSSEGPSKREERSLQGREAGNQRVNALLSAAELTMVEAAPQAVSWLLQPYQQLVTPISSPGGTLICWKRFFPRTEEETAALFFAQRYADTLLNALAHFPEPLWNTFADRLLRSRDKFLAERVVDLLAVRSSPEAISILRRYSQQSGAPYTRFKSMVTLYRLGEHPELFSLLIRWFLEKIQSPLSMELQPGGETAATASPHDLPLAEETRLLLEFVEAVAAQHDQRALLPLLEALPTSAKENRPLVAALLLNLLG